MLLIVNPGSSSIKVTAFREENGSLSKMGNKTAEGFNGVNSLPDNFIDDFCKGLEVATSEITHIGIRFVHGGYAYKKPTVITPQVLNDIGKISDLAPLHIPLALRVSEALIKILPKIPLIAVFDTEFHESMPDVARLYALPEMYDTAYHIQRYGFHGFAHASMLELYAQEKLIDKAQSNIITVQLGSGSSMCAIKNGKSVDTSMGFSPLEGLISRTRSGDIDPTVVSYLSSHLGKNPQEVYSLLNKESGLKGISGTSGDMRELMELIGLENKQAKLAIEMFIYKIQKYLGGYDYILGGTDGVVFGGGISEHCPEIIRGIINNPNFGATILPEYTIEESLKSLVVSTASSKCTVMVVRVDEELEMAKRMLTCYSLTKD